MNEVLSGLRIRLSELWNPADALINWIDILLVTLIIYRLLKLVQGRRAWRIVFGALAFVFVLLLSDFLHLRTLHYLLAQATLLAPVALVVLFLPELRQALEGLTRLGFWSERLIPTSPYPSQVKVDELIVAVESMARSHTGALIVVERGGRLDEVVANGISVNAQVSAPLLEAIFHGENPLHDGAAVIRGNEIVAAGCRLPLSDSSSVDRTKHMRHRAGLGISEQSDCIVVIVSEERGKISVAHEGKLNEIEHIQDLRSLLRRDGPEEAKA